MILSIITVCFNDVCALRKTFESVDSQNGIMDLGDSKQIEYIIIDGGSNDGSTLFLEDIQNKYSWVKFISEPDNGIYDAMNKGMNIATGDYIEFLNAGDCFYSKNTIEDVISYLTAHEADVFYGKAIKYDLLHEEIFECRDITMLLNEMPFCHQAIFFRRKCHLEFPYDLRYRLASDYNSVLKMYLNGKRFFKINECLVNYDMMGVSGIHLDETYKEITMIRINNKVIKWTFIAKFLFYLGLFKRKILKRMPRRIRWKMAALVKRRR